MGQSGKKWGVVGVWPKLPVPVNKSAHGPERQYRADVLQFVLPPRGRREAARPDPRQMATHQGGHGTDAGSLAKVFGRAVPSRFATRTNGVADERH